MTMSRDATCSVVPSMSKAWPATCQNMASTIGATNPQLRDCVLHGYQSGLLGRTHSQTHEDHGCLPIDIQTGNYALAQCSQDYCSATSCVIYGTQTGQYNTAPLKRYPEALCAALTEIFVQGCAKIPHTSTHQDELEAVFVEMEELCNHSVDYGERDGMDYAPKTPKQIKCIPNPKGCVLNLDSSCHEKERMQLF